MSSIYRLKIQGIRSFGPDKDDEAIIKFSSPLTLILGQNGCGKTTIIEALKYACCGELPAGTDGGSGFVHDPKLANLNEVKGNIKLECRDAKGSLKTVSRAVRVIQKFKKLEFKSLDSCFIDHEKGTKDMITGKCADIDAVMCQTLGTSQAVLTNVIFCHQEDSLWPLEKGKKVKEKFDAIFGITEYNKCLDYLRAMSKELDTKKAILKKDVECSSKFWTEAQEKRKKLDEFKGKANANRDVIRQVEADMGPINSEIEEIVNKETNYSVYTAKIRSKKDQKDFTISTVNSMKENIRTEFCGSKDALKEEINTFQKRLEETKNKVQELKNEKQDLEAEEKRIDKDIGTKQMQIGQLQKEEDLHRDRIDTRNKRLRDLGNELGIDAVSYSQLNDSSSEDVMRDIENKIEKRSTELKDMQEDHKRLEDQMQKEINVCREKRAALTQDVSTKKKTIESHQREIAKVQKEIEEVDKSGNELASLENSLKAVDKELSETTASLNVDQCKSGMEKTNDDIKKLEEKSVLLDKEIRKLQEISGQKEILNKMIERQRNLEKDLATLENKHRDTLQHLLSSVPETKVQEKLKSRINELEKEISTHENEINKLGRDLSTLKEKKRSLDEQIKKMRKKMSQDQAKIEDCCGDVDIHAYHKEQKEQLQHYTELRGSFASSKLVYGKFLEKLQSEEKVCPLCHREFTDLTDYDDILEDLRGRIAEFPAKLVNTEADIKKYQAAEAKAADLLQLGNELKKAQEELPKLKENLNGIEKEIDSVESRMKSHQNDLEGPKSDKGVATKILPDIIKMDQLKEEVRKVKSEVENQEKKIPASASGKTLEQANEEQDKLKSDLSNLRKKLSADQQALVSYNDRVNKLHKRKTELTARQLQIVGGAQKRASLTEKLDDLNMMLAVLQSELEQAQEKLKPIGEEIDAQNLSLRQKRTQHERLLDAKREQINNLRQAVKEIKDLQFVIASYAKKGGSRRLVDTKQEYEQQKSRKQNLEDRKNILDKELDAKNKFQNTHELQKHDLEANLKWREEKEKLAKIEEEIRELEGRVVVSNYDQLRRKKEQLEKKRKDLENQKSRADGQLQVVMSNISDLENELKQPHYKDAEDEHRKSVVQLTVTSKSVDDLKLYEKAMDWAMIHFHKERMKMINQTIRELWRHIYRGNDIDYIEIKTDEGSSTASGRRTYNYKVVQVKSGVEIDMPGRCSAGQKVLACLIIRMALAEAFCKNCGILALDEPTTNLDRENVESLSDALADIVERRSGQRNFQLLVITHDEEFLKKLFRVERVEQFLEVKRDDRGRSKVFARSTYL